MECNFDIMYPNVRLPDFARFSALFLKSKFKCMYVSQDIYKTFKKPNVYLVSKLYSDFDSGFPNMDDFWFVRVSLNAPILTPRSV